MTRRRLIGLGAGAVSVGAAGLVRFLAITERPAPYRHIILIVADSLRADRLGCYGYRREIMGVPQSITPNLDALAERGALFEAAFAQSNWTETSMASMLCSAWPFVNGPRHSFAYLPGPEETLAYQLNYGYMEDRPYNKVAVQSNRLLIASPFAGAFDAIINVSGFPRVFKNGTTEPSRELLNERADVVSQKALGVISRIRKWNLFLYAHYMDVHEPYAPVSRFRELFEAGQRYDFGELAAGANAGPADESVRARIEALRDDYDASLMFLDEQIGLLLGELEEQGVLRDSLLIFAADHGQSLGERGFVGHANTLYPHETHVPLILAGGTVPAARIRTRVRNIDIFPTIAQHIGVNPRQQGESLLPLVEAARENVFTRHREVYACMDFPPRCSHLKREMLIAPSGAAYIVTSDSEGRLVGEEHFDVSSDPHMRLALAQADVRAALRARMGDFKKLGARRTARGPGGIYGAEDPTRTSYLRSLGYIN